MNMAFSVVIDVTDTVLVNDLAFLTSHPALFRREVRSVKAVRRMEQR